MVKRDRIMAKKSTQSIVVKNSFNTSDTTANIMVENNISYVPKISVIMPVYNGELYLRECLDSVINQTLREIEIICVDDGSTDGSLEILREYAKQDERITILTQQNLFAGVARNAGLVVARGEYVIFLDCDDFFELNMLQDMYDMATQDKSDIVVCGHHIYDDKNKRIKISRKSSTEIFNKSPFAPSEIKGDLLSFIDPAPWNKLYRKSLLMDNDIRFSALRICNDLTCVSTLFAVSSKISVLNNYYIYYRTNFAKQLSSTRSKHLDCFVAAFNELIENLRRFKVLDIYKETLTNRINSSLKYELSNCNMADRQVFMELLWNTLDKELLEILYVLPKICVIVPVYNVEEYLAKCLDSVINQTYKNLEIICVNDGSTDSSAKILDEYAKKDCRIKIINQKNQGLSAARNTGMSNCTSEYVYFLDSDDYIAPETIDLLYIEMIRNDADTSFAGVVCFGDGIVEKSAVVSKQQWFDKFMKKTGVQPVPVDIRSEIVPTAWNTLYKMSIIKKHNIQFPVGLINEDEYWLWAYMIHCKKYVNINVPTYYYLQRANSIMGTCAASTKCLDIIEIFKRIYETILSQDKMGQYSGMMKPLLSLYINNTLNKLPSERYGDFVEKLNSIAAMSKMSKDVAGVCEKITSKYTADVLEILSDKAPTVSVIMPVYNAEKYLRESMNCLMRQTLCNIEIICVNDCSTDGSLDILREYADVNPRVKIINNKNNIGSAASRNVALSVARGMYIGFIDSDDLINDGYFMNLFAASKYGQYDIGATGVVTLFTDDCDDTTRKNVGIHEKEYVISGDTERAKIIVSTGVSWNKIYKKSFLDANNIKCLEIKNAAEDNYFTDLAVMFADKIGVTSKSEYFYRQNPVSQTKVLKGKKDIQITMII